MKTVIKLFLIIWLAIALLGTGLYLVLNNLGFMLTEEHSAIQYRVIDAGFEISIGHWLERVQMKLPIHIKQERYKLECQSGKNVVTVYTRPKMKMTWKRLTDTP